MPNAVTALREADALPQPYLLFLGDTTEPGYAKTAFGLRDWAGERCVGEFACEGASVSVVRSRDCTLLEVRGARLAVGSSIAAGIMVLPVV